MKRIIFVVLCLILGAVYVNADLVNLSNRSTARVKVVLSLQRPDALFSGKKVEFILKADESLPTQRFSESVYAVSVFSEAEDGTWERIKDWTGGMANVSPDMYRIRVAVDAGMMVSIQRNNTNELIGGE